MLMRWFWFLGNVTTLQPQALFPSHLTIFFRSVIYSSHQERKTSLLSPSESKVRNPSMYTVLLLLTTYYCPVPLILSAIYPFRQLPPPEKHPRLLVCHFVPQETPNLPVDIRKDDCRCNLLDEGRLTGLRGVLRPPLGYTYIRLHTPVALTLREILLRLLASGFVGWPVPFFFRMTPRSARF